MSGRECGMELRVNGTIRASAIYVLTALAVLACICAPRSQAQQLREREPNSVYAARRAKLALNIDGPIILFG